MRTKLLIDEMIPLKTKQTDEGEETLECHLDLKSNENYLQMPRMESPASLKWF